MIDVLELVSDGDVLDTVTFNEGRISYATGEARSLVEARLKLLPDRVEALRSLAGWSNGYVTLRPILPARFVEPAPDSADDAE